MALVGLTGSGKSTLAMLPPRLFDVTAGVVAVDGVDVRDMTRATSCATRVAVAFEDPTLFSASVRDNVLLGVADAVPAAERDLDQALEVAQAALRRTTCPTASTPASARRAMSCPAGSGSASRSPAPSPLGRACSCSTTRCPRSTSRTEEAVDGPRCGDVLAAPRPA